MSGCLIKMKIILSFTLFLLLSFQHVWSQDNFRVMFYNVENLFDTKDNPNKNDDDFLPQGKQRWSNYRYWKKLNDISKVIDSVGNGRPPAIVGLCEVENDSVLFDLTRRSDLRKHKYEYIISDSKDPRGINVALLYQRDEMKVLKVKEYVPVFRNLPESPTRNILHVSGKIINGDILDIFVCHFKSRSGGIKKTHPYRVQSAELLKQKVDSVMKVRKNPLIIIMGDFNDYPHDKSMKEVLSARKMGDKVQDKNLYNIFYHNINENKNGSYRYRGKWIFPDQFLVNGSLLNLKGQTRIKKGEGHVFSAGFLLEDDQKYGGKRPFRTYLGYKYLGGYSDHLPIYFDLEIIE